MLKTTIRSIAPMLAVVVAAAAGLAFTGSGGAESAIPAGKFFVVSCPFSHSAPDDPIVYPGLPHHSHDHAFFGNTSTNARSTIASLAGHTTSCSDPADVSAYWAPTLYAAGVPVPPVEATIYYRRLTTAPVHVFPRGLEVVAGNSHAVTRQSAQITTWYCSVLKSSFYGTLARSATLTARIPTSAPYTPAAGIPVCAARTHLELEVNFPDCSNGKATSIDHQSQMAYSVAGVCPASHPIAVPAISLSLRYPDVTSKNVFLSSGGVYSGHADFMDSWKPKALSKLVAECLNQGKNCGIAASPAPDIS